MKRIRMVLITFGLGLLMSACGPQAGGELTPVTLMLDWVPNTNHTGFYVAQANGYFEDAGLDVTIIEPGEVFAEQAVLSNVAEFGVSFQEQVTLARAKDISLVSIAAIIQHNTSGFASRAVLGADSPADWEGLRYGSFSSPFEEPTLRVLMECDDGNFDDLEIQNVGFSDPLALLDEQQIDLAWIFYAWQGTQANQQDIDLNVVMLQDWFECIPDYYTPVIIASEEMLQEKPEIVTAFLQAVSNGYTYAIQNPLDAAALLLQAVPELDGELVRASQEWLSPRYQAEADRWGFQQQDVWENYANWMVEHGILKGPIDSAGAFSNDFLP